MRRFTRTILGLLVSAFLAACSGPQVLSQTPDSITFAFPSGRYGVEDVKEDAEAYCKKRGLNAELRGNKFCTAPCLSCPLQCRATFICN